MINIPSEKTGIQVHGYSQWAKMKLKGTKLTILLTTEPVSLTFIVRYIFLEPTITRWQGINLHSVNFIRYHCALPARTT